MSSFLGNTDSIFEKCARFLTLNTIQELLTLQEALVFICKKITDNPTELKYRKLKFDSKLIQSQIITAKGGLEFLTGIGMDLYRPLNFALFIFLINSIRVSQSHKRRWI